MKKAKNICIIILLIVLVIATAILVGKDKTRKDSGDVKIYEDSIYAVKRMSPEGFAGSMLYSVALYSNGDVYVETYSGSSDNEVISNEKIAQNAEDIDLITDGEYAGGIVVSGESIEVIDNSYSWIVFTK